MTAIAVHPRPLHAIAAEIRADWGTPWFGAEPYLDAMGCLTDMDSMFGLDDADTVVRYFLSNAKTWKGETARRVKAELKELIA